MLGLLLGAGAAGWLAGESIRRGRRIRRGLGITAEEYAREQQAFREKFEPGPAARPGGYVSCVPNASDRQARENLCKIASAMDEATSEREAATYQDAFDKAWGKLTQGQKDCMYGWVKENCPSVYATFDRLLHSQLSARIEALQATIKPPLPPPTPTKAALPRTTPLELPVYQNVELSPYPAGTPTGMRAPGGMPGGAIPMPLAQTPTPTTASWGPASGSSLGPTGAAMAVTGPQVPLPYGGGGGMPGIVGQAMSLAPAGGMTYGGALSGHRPAGGGLGTL